MKKSLLIFALLLLLVLAFGVVSCKKADAQKVQPEKLCYDIQKIQLDMEYSALKDLYDPEPFEQLKADVMAGKIDRKECIYRLKEIFCSYHVVHLRLAVAQDNHDFSSGIFPFVLMCFGDDYHIITAAKKYEKYLGSKVLEIGGVPIEESLKRLSKYIPYETPSGLKHSFERGLTYDTMEHVGLTEKNGKIKVKLQKQNGAVETFSCKPVVASKTKFSALPLKKENPMLTVQDRSVNYGIKASKEKGTVYVHFNRVIGDPDYLVTVFFNDLLTELGSDSYDTVVFDLRYNGGGMGDFEILLSHLLYDNKAEFEKYNLALITTGRTASAACWFTNDFLRIFPKTVIFGEETGEAIFNYTDIPLTNELKNLQCDFAFPHQIDDHVDELYKRAAKVTHSDIHRGTMPDVEVHEKFEDFVNGEDTIYNAIYDYFCRLPRRPAGSSQ